MIGLLIKLGLGAVGLRVAFTLLCYFVIYFRLIMAAVGYVALGSLSTLYLPALLLFARDRESTRWMLGLGLLLFVVGGVAAWLAGVGSDKSDSDGKSKPINSK